MGGGAGEALRGCLVAGLARELAGFTLAEDVDCLGRTRGVAEVLVLIVEGRETCYAC